LDSSRPAIWTSAARLGHARLFPADSGEIGLDFAGPDFIHHVPDGEVLPVKVLWCKHLRRAGIFTMKNTVLLVPPGISVNVVIVKMPPLEIAHLDRLKEFEGREAPPTDWFVLTQDRIQKFAEATEDRQWIHLDSERAARESSYGSTIAHGFLTLSLLSYFSQQAIRVREGAGMRINYGLNRVRFPSPVKAGSAMRARVILLTVTESPQFVDAVFSVAIETQGVDKPCCVAEWLVRYYRA
jgi:acyl dehydratase